MPTPGSVRSEAVSNVKTCMAEYSHSQQTNVPSSEGEERNVPLVPAGRHSGATPTVRASVRDVLNQGLCMSKCGKLWSEIREISSLEIP